MQGEVQLEYREFDAGHFKNYTKTVSLEGGQLKMIEKNRMNCVMNVDGGDTKVYLDPVSDVTLAKSQRNPLVGNYVGAVELVKLRCLETSSAPPVEIEVIKVPAPPGEKVPIPVPKLRTRDNLAKEQGAEKK